MHARCDGAGRPLGFVLTGGQVHDAKAFLELLRLVGERVRAMLADKGYDSDAIREALLGCGSLPVIPPKANRKDPPTYDRAKYKERNRIERLFNRLKNWRRLATRYDKTADSFLGFYNLVASLVWLPFVNRT